MGLISFHRVPDLYSVCRCFSLAKLTPGFIFEVIPQVYTSGLKYVSRHIAQLRGAGFSWLHCIFCCQEFKPFSTMFVTAEDGSANGTRRCLQSCSQPTMTRLTRQSFHVFSTFNAHLWVSQMFSALADEWIMYSSPSAFKKIHITGSSPWGIVPDCKGQLMKHLVASDIILIF